MKKLALFLMLGLSFILATPNISSAGHFIGVGRFGVVRSRPVVVERRPFIVEHRPFIVERGPVFVERPFVIGPRPFFVSSFFVSPFFFDPFVAFNFGFVIR